MTPENIRETLRRRHSDEEKARSENWKLVKDFWFDTGCLAKDLIAMSDDELNELWARFVFNRIAEAKEA